MCSVFWIRMPSGSNVSEKALNEKLMELSAQTGQFYRGTLRRGDTLESESSIIVIGDVGAWGQDHGKGKCDRLGRS